MAEVSSAARGQTASPTRTEPERFADGPVTGQVVGTFNGGDSLKAGQRSSQTFDTLEAANAYARSLDTPAAVVGEGQKFAVYRVEGPGGLWGTGLWATEFSRANAFQSGQAMTDDFTIVSTYAPTTSGNARVYSLVTTDDYVVDLQRGSQSALMRAPSGDPFAPQVQAFGPGLQRLTDRERFTEQFELAMRDTAYASLDQGERAAREVLQRLQGRELTAYDRTAIAQTIERLKPIDAAIAAKERELSQARRDRWGADMAVGAGQGFASRETLAAQVAAHDRVTRLNAELGEMQAQRVQAAQTYPLLLRVGDVSRFQAMPAADQLATLRNEANGVLRDVQGTRESLDDGSFDLWTNPNLVSTTAGGLGLGGEQLKWVQDKAVSEGRWETARNVGLGAVTVGLAVGGAFFTGGTSLALLGASAALGVYSAADLTADYLRDSAAANTQLDPTAGLIPRDQVPHWGWVAAAWIGVGLDAAAVGGAIKALQAGAKAADVAQTLGVEARFVEQTLSRRSLMQLAETRRLDPAEFALRFGSDAALGATTFERGADGKMVMRVYLRNDLPPETANRVLREEFYHANQLSDPRFAEQAARLSDAELARWPRMTMAERAQVLEAKLTLEIDANRHLLSDTRGLSPETVADLRAGGQALERKLADLQEGLRSGQWPAWLATEPAPQLLAKSRYVQTNLEAEAAYGLQAPEGHYFYRTGNTDKPFELRRFADDSNQSAAPRIEPMTVVRNARGEWELAPRASDAAARLEQRLADFGQEGSYARLEAALARGDVSPYTQAYARQYAGVLQELEVRGVDIDALIRRTDGMTVAKGDETLRHAIYDASLRVIQEAPARAGQGGRMDVLQRLLDAQPNNAARGELFHRFREANPGSTELRLVDLRSSPNATTLEAFTEARRADGAVEVTRSPAGVNGPRTLGRYLAEDKAGPNAFDLAQAKQYDEALQAGDGRITARSGDRYEGIVYFFSNRDAAQAAALLMDREGLDAALHVAFYQADGSLGWFR